MKNIPACEYCDEDFRLEGDDNWVPECDCEEREGKRAAAQDAYWDRKIDEARGK